MFGTKKPRILFFILACSPTVAQVAHAEKIGAVFRNATGCGEGDAVENADAVCGAVPACYLTPRKGYKVPEVVPIPEELIDRPALRGAAAQAALEAKAAKVATPAPVAPVPPVVATLDAQTPPPPAPVVTRTPEQQAQRDAEDTGAKGATAAQLKEALTQLGITFASNTPKKELLARYLARP